jgi:predicted alpha/beta hydrolase family esterase
LFSPTSANTIGKAKAIATVFEKIAMLLFFWIQTYTLIKMKDMKYTLLIVTGLGDSAETHWQNYWLQHFETAQKVIQKDWDNPLLEDWLESLNTAIESAEGEIIIVAHSLSCSLISHWSKENKTHKIAGALLVAPADVDSPAHTPEQIRNFSPIPLLKLDYPSIVITSSNDPYISVERAAFLARQWGSSFINIGEKGHLNSESKLEYWEEGQKILQSLVKIIESNK